MEKSDIFRKWKTLVVYGIVFMVSCTSAYLLFATNDLPNYENRLKLHNEIVQGSAASPYKYRLLVPKVTELIIRGVLDFLSPKKAFLLSYALYDVIAFLFLFGTLFWYLRFWFSDEKSLLGILIVGSTISVVLRDQYYQPWSYLDVGLFTLSLVLIYKNHFKWLAIVIILASLNRETAIFIPLAFLFANMNVGADGLLGVRWSRSVLGRFCILGLLWLVTYGGIRLVEGDAIRIISVAEIWHRNIQAAGLLYTVTQNFFFGIILYPMAILGFRKSPGHVKRTSLVIPFYLVTVLVFSLWWEVRLLMILYPILVPIALSCINQLSKKQLRDVDNPA
jgi:hypothetical protein